MVGLLPALAARIPVQQRVALVVAHPDDETIAAGASLHLFPTLLLVHVTDGAPRNLPDHLDDATRLGFATPDAYADAREAELAEALDIAAVQPIRATLGLPDQATPQFMLAIASDLGRLFAQHGTEAILTHPYEGGHPDHDSTALAVHLAGRRLGIAVFEFAGYHAGPDRETEYQRFLPGPPETLVRLEPEEAELKRAMYDAFVTQSAVLAPFSTSVERFRPAPGYDFTAAPHPGPLNYENWGWPMTGDRWRTLARECLECAA